MTDQTAVPCNAAQLHRFGDLQSAHGPHKWIVQPGMDPVRCPGAGEPPAAPAVQAPAADRVALRDRIAETLYERERPPRDPHWPKAFAADREVFEATADAVLAVLPAPTDRAAVLRQAADVADGLEAPKVAMFLRGMAVQAEQCRMADETQPAEALRPATIEWTFEACYDADNDKWHGTGGTYTDRDQARADFENLKRTDTANRLTHYSPRLKVRLVRATTTYVVEAERDPADAAQQDGARS